MIYEKLKSSALPITGLLACLFALHWETFEVLFHYWWVSSTYGHGLLVLPLCVYLVWQKWAELKPVYHRPAFTGLLALLFFSICGWAVYLVDIAIGKEVVLIAMTISVFWSVSGWGNTRSFLLPLLLPIMALSVWGPLAQVLQYITTQIVSFVLLAINVPVFTEGHYIHIPEGKFSIEEVCAGLRYLLAAVTISLVFGYLNLNKLKSSLFLLVFAVLMSLLVNWVRVFVVILSGHLTNMTHFFVRDHADLGWWLFAITLIPIFLMGRFLQNREMSGNQNSQADSQWRMKEIDPRYTGKMVVLFPIAFAIVTMPPLWAFSLKSNITGQSLNPKNALTAPEPGKNWNKSAMLSHNALSPVFKEADQQLFSAYNNGSKTDVQLYIASYQTQTQGKELISESNSFHDKDVWQSGEIADRRLAIGAGKKLVVSEMIITNNLAKKRLIWGWYSVAGVNTTNPLIAKVLSLKDIINHNQDGASVFIISIRLDGDVVAAREKLLSFLNAIIDATNRKGGDGTVYCANSPGPLCSSLAYNHL